MHPEGVGRDYAAVLYLYGLASFAFDRLGIEEHQCVDQTEPTTSA
jgi:hypothetical protein